ncbi:signal peptidase I [Gorillibacterium timonense]|uniref:signal peptidase I n=1 Tax=Gorillibacterium timonense TaxID=1689269 RepID=UPI00071DF406|nr:signal peptidase I [Gorillibacterium timonense]
MSQWLSRVSSWLWSLGIAFVLSLLISTFIIQPTKVLGQSMEPTLRDHSRILIAKWGHSLGETPKYGDIVIIDSRIDRKRGLHDDLLEYPLFQWMSGASGRDIFWVKRVVGKAGDVLEIRNNQVYRNGEPLDEPYLKEKMTTSGIQIITVPDGCIYVMGDNRNHSKDSRFLGAVPIGHVIGKKL